MFWSRGSCIAETNSPQTLTRVTYGSFGSNKSLWYNTRSSTIYFTQNPSQINKLRTKWSTKGKYKTFKHLKKVLGLGIPLPIKTIKELSIQSSFASKSWFLSCSDFTVITLHLPAHIWSQTCICMICENQLGGESLPNLFQDFWLFSSSHNFCSPYNEFIPKILCWIRT